MRQWFRRLWGKTPETPVFPISAKDWPGLMAELADGYEKHQAVFQAVQIMIKRAERETFRAPVLKTPGDVLIWMIEQYGMVREVNGLREVLRLPIEASRLAKRQEARKAAEEESEPAPLD